MAEKKIVSSMIMGILLGVYGYPAISASAATQDLSTVTDVTFTPGRITLQEVPSIIFGDQEISTIDETYEWTNSSFIKVDDLRGSAAGWNVTVKQTAQLATAEGEELTNAQINMKNGKLTTTGSDTAKITDAILLPGKVTKIMDASVGTGTGSFKGTWSTDGVTLEVPGTTKQLAKQYTADLEWVLTEAP